MAGQSRVLATFILLTVGCGDPMAQEVDAYFSQMDPLMARNTELASMFVGLVGELYKEKEDIDKIAKSIETDVIPAADELKTAINAIHPGDPNIQDIHDQAITAWTIQAEGYHELMAAYAANDQAAFNSAYKKIGQAKVMAESYVQDINGLLGPYGFHLEEFPDPL